MFSVLKRFFFRPKKERAVARFVPRSQWSRPTARTESPAPAPTQVFFEQYREGNLAVGYIVVDDSKHPAKKAGEKVTLLAEGAEVRFSVDTYFWFKRAQQWEC